MLRRCDVHNEMMVPRLQTVDYDSVFPATPIWVCLHAECEQQWIAGSYDDVLEWVQEVTAIKHVVDHREVKNAA